MGSSKPRDERGFFIGTPNYSENLRLDVLNDPLARRMSYVGPTDEYQDIHQFTFIDKLKKTISVKVGGRLSRA